MKRRLADACLTQQRRAYAARIAAWYEDIFPLANQQVLEVIMAAQPVKVDCMADGDGQASGVSSQALKGRNVRSAGQRRGATRVRRLMREGALRTFLLSHCPAALALYPPYPVYALLPAFVGGEALREAVLERARSRGAGLLKGMLAKSRARRCALRLNHRMHTAEMKNDLIARAMRGK